MRGKDKNPFEDETEEEREAREQRAEEAAQRKRNEEIADMKRSLSHDYVRRTLFRILDVCGPFESIWSPGAELARNCGKQEVGQTILGMIGEADAHALGNMISEQYSQKLKESIA